MPTQVIDELLKPEYRDKAKYSHGNEIPPDMSGSVGFYKVKEGKLWRYFHDHSGRIGSSNTGSYLCSFGVTTPSANNKITDDFSKIVTDYVEILPSLAQFVEDVNKACVTTRHSLIFNEKVIRLLYDYHPSRCGSIDP